MAALSRPSLRSTSQRIVGVELSATGSQRKSSTHIPKIGKRTRDSVSLNDGNSTLKKQKTGTQELPRHNVTQGHNADFLVAPADQSAQAALLRGVDPQNTKPEHTRRDPNGIRTNTVETKISPEDVANAVGTVVEARKVDKRSLRSQDGGSRSKSELALYFPNYDELVSIEPKEPEYLTTDTIVHITDEPIKSVASSLHSSTVPSYASYSQEKRGNQLYVDANGFRKTPEEMGQDLMALNDAQKIDFSSIEGSTKLLGKDPMTDAVYFKAHRRAERQEKQLRNIEKERAQHEKVQLERLLDGLKGHDWLRVMGISGITDSEKKLYEPKREYFVREVESLLEKFRVWKEEEKRRKFEKEQKAGEDDEDGSEATDSEPDYSDVDAWAARQLHREASSANGTQTGRSRNHRSQPANAVSPPIEKPFTSFFSKPYLREAALGKHRRGRKRFAFGHPVPDLFEHDFALPSDLLTTDALKASARSRRRANRGSRDQREKPN